jgi:hypothetical protein
LSRPRSSTRGSTTPATRSGGNRTAGRPGVYVATPKSDIYVALLGTALGAMILSCVLLIILLGRYEFKITAL